MENRVFARDPPGATSPASKKRRLEDMDIPVHNTPTTSAIAQAINAVSPYQTDRVHPSQTFHSPTSQNEAKTPERSDVPKVNRSSKACLSCRKLKTKCEGADNPPCRRCRSGNHECIFVESKRGKRPAKKPQGQNGNGPVTSAQTQEKLKHLENTLQTVLQSLQAGTIPDEKVLESIKSYSSRLNLTSSISSDIDPALTTSSFLTPTQASLPVGSRTSSINRPGASNLSILADASLVAELEGSKGISALDHNFKLSTLTDAISEVEPNSPLTRNDGPSPKVMVNSKEPHPETPALFVKGILDADTAVELFRIFFDYCFLHIPLFDPRIHTVTNLISKSTFLFTSICAVASRFHKGANKLQEACYREAHECYVKVCRNGASSLESVQACMLLTAWCFTPEDQFKICPGPKRAWMYFGMAIRMGMELGLFRPSPLIERHPELRHGLAKDPHCWNMLKEHYTELELMEEINKERTWLLAFVMDRCMAAAMGRPYQIHGVKPTLLPTHPLTAPLDLGIIAHVELQSIMGQVIDTFRDRIYGDADANNEMPSVVVMKLFNSRMDEWKSRWLPSQGALPTLQPVSSALLLYFYNSKLFLNTFPLQVMFRNSETVEDPDSVAACIMAAKQSCKFSHELAKQGLLIYAPDVFFLYTLYSVVFLIKVKVSNSRFAQLIENDELLHLILQAIEDTQGNTIIASQAAENTQVMLKVLLASWRTMRINSTYPSSSSTSLAPHPFTMPPVMPPTQAHTPRSVDGRSTGITPRYPIGSQNPNVTSGSPVIQVDGGAGAPLDTILYDSGFFDSILVSRGFDGFFSWPDNSNDPQGRQFDFLNNILAQYDPSSSQSVSSIPTEN